MLACAAKPEVEALVAGLARPAPAELAFVEIRYSHLVNRPLRSSGVLRRDGGTLEKRMLKPRRERVAIDANHATIERNKQVRRVALARAPELRALLGSFGALMDGDTAALDEHFDASVVRDDAGWTLALVPRDEAVRRRATIEVSGSGSAVRCIAVREPDDDVSVMAVGSASEGLEPVPDRAALLRHCRGGT